MNNQLIEQYQNFVFSLTHYFEWYQNKDDLYQAGMIGLLKAYKKYDENLGIKFTTYAYKHILGEMKKYIREDKILRPSPTLKKIYYESEKIKILLTQKYMRVPSLDEIALELNIPTSKLEYCISVITNSTNIQSLDDDLNSEGKTVNLYDIIEDKKMDINTLIALKFELEKLNITEQQIIKWRYFDNLTQNEIANNIGVNQVQVSRLEEKIKQKLKNSLKEKDFV
ncbi:MAG: sigma-70 family RNA polymerase sigma factor [Bacilli bacterium]